MNDPSPEAIVEAIRHDPIKTWGDLKRLAAAYDAHIIAEVDVNDSDPIRQLYYVNSAAVKESHFDWENSSTAIADDGGQWPNITIEFWSNTRLKEFMVEFKSRRQPPP
jgi:hypothetical protein